MSIEWCARLRDLASGKLKGDIPSIEYSLAADEIEKLTKRIEILNEERNNLIKIHESCASQLFDAKSLLRETQYKTPCHDWAKKRDAFLCA